MDKKVMFNDRAHKFGDNRKEVQITVNVVLDMVPGWGHNIEDHVKLLLSSNSYAVSASYEA